MDNLLLTILAAVILMGLVIAGLAIGLLLTGKNRLKRGCGKVPRKGKEEEPGSCPLCGEEEKCPEKGEENR
ncbi:MAG: hypothetical protein K940chlam9_00855 [Chlamydiae bacterium]|nr:hypothetical protein [Chlamydiota bacterium]